MQMIVFLHFSAESLLGRLGWRHRVRIFSEAQRGGWGWGAPGRPESKCQAVLGHFFVPTRPFVHQQSPTSP